MSRKMVFLLFITIFFMLTFSKPATGIQYSYDNLNRLWRIIFDDGTAVVYEYDDVGNRLSELVDAPPNIPSSPSIPDGAGDVALNTDVSWVGGDPENHAVTYDLFLDTSQQPTTRIAAGLSTPGFYPPNLSCDTTYYWSVTSIDQYGAVKQGPIWRFSTSKGDPVKNASGGTSSSLITAYSDASNGDTLLTQDVQLTEDFTAGSDKSVTIDGGYNCDFSVNPSMTVIKGALRITGGVVTLKNIHISNQN